MKMLYLARVTATLFKGPIFLIINLFMYNQHIFYFAKIHIFFELYIYIPKKWANIKVILPILWGNKYTYMPFLWGNTVLGFTEGTKKNENWKRGFQGANTNWKVKIENWKKGLPRDRRTIEVPTLSENNQRCQKNGNLQLFGINHYQGNAHYMIICKNMNFR